MKANGGYLNRKFWREMLPRIKYRNPTVPIEISRHQDPHGPALLKLYMTTPSSSIPTASDLPPTSSTSATPSARDSLTPSTATPTHTVDIRMVAESEILAHLVSRTGAEEIKATEEEEAELVELADSKGRRDKDRVEVLEKLTKARREAELLRLARGEVPVGPA
jgi:large subunit ribosomal protein MRP49